MLCLANQPIPVVKADTNQEQLFNTLVFLQQDLCHNGICLIDLDFAYKNDKDNNEGKRHEKNLYDFNWFCCLKLSRLWGRR